MSDFKAKMHQIRFPLGLAPDPAREHTALPRSVAVFKDTLRGVRGKWEEVGGNGMEGEQERRRGGDLPDDCQTACCAPVGYRTHRSSFLFGTRPLYRTPSLWPDFGRVYGEECQRKGKWKENEDGSNGMGWDATKFGGNRHPGSSIIFPFLVSCTRLNWSDWQCL